MAKPIDVDELRDLLRWLGDHRVKARRECTILICGLRICGVRDERHAVALA